MNKVVVARIEQRLAEMESNASSIGRAVDIELFHLACAAILQAGAVIDEARAKLALAMPVLADLQGTIDKLDAVGEQEPHVVELYRFTREARTLFNQVSNCLSSASSDKAEG